MLAICESLSTALGRAGFAWTTGLLVADASWILAGAGFGVAAAGGAAAVCAAAGFGLGVGMAGAAAWTAGAGSGAAATAYIGFGLNRVMLPSAEAKASMAGVAASAVSPHSAGNLRLTIS